MSKKLWTMLLDGLSSQLPAIASEVSPPDDRKRRLDSNTFWEELKKYFKLDRKSTKNEQGCTTDVRCFRDKLIETGLDVVSEKQLEQIQKIITSAHRPPYNSLKDWFVPVNKKAKEKFGVDSDRTKLIAKYMKSPEATQLIQRREADEGVIKRNKQGLYITYPETLKIIQYWIISPDWRDQLLAVMAATGPRKTAILDKKIKFVEAEQDGHDKRFWIKQIGVLKDKHQKFEEEDDAKAEMISGKIIEKPIAFGLTFDLIKKAIKNIRVETDVKGLTRAEIGNKYGKQLVDRVKHAFPGPAGQNKRLGTHFLRAVYANVSYHFFNSQVGDSLTSFIADVLAHDSGSLNTGLSYQTIRIQWGMPDDIEADTRKQTLANRDAIAMILEREKKEKKEEFDLWDDNKEDDGSDDDSFIPRVRIRHRRKLKRPFIDFKNGDNTIRVPFPKRKRQSHENLLENVRETADLLKQAGVPVDKQTLRDMGYGAATVIEAWSLLSP